MLTAPAPASQKAFARAGMQVEDINVNGGAIALGERIRARHGTRPRWRRGTYVARIADLPGDHHRPTYHPPRRANTHRNAIYSLLRYPVASRGRVGENTRAAWDPPQSSSAAERQAPLGGALAARRVVRAVARSKPPVYDGRVASSLGAGFAAPSVALPKGGGAIRGIGETFATNPVTGTSGLTIPLPLSPGRSGFTPALTLSYDSGAGNGPFGLGWTIALPAITRRTDRGLPRYLDAQESDVFLLAGAEDLVPVLRADGSRHEEIRDGFLVRRYRPRVEGLFARIERWTKLDDPSETHWRSISRTGSEALRKLQRRQSDPAKVGLFDNIPLTEPAVEDLVRNILDNAVTQRSGRLKVSGYAGQHGLAFFDEFGRGVLVRKDDAHFITFLEEPRGVGHMFR